MAKFEPVLLTLPSLVPSLSVEVLAHGVTFHRFIVRVEGKTHDIVIGPEDPKDHATMKHINTIIGRYANRVPVGTHEIERKGVKGIFTAQANESPLVSLHGGPVGYGYVPWKQTGSPILFSAAEIAHLSSSSYTIFQLVSPDGDQGFPGELTLEALVALVEPPLQVKSSEERSLGSLVYVYRAKVAHGVTPINLTNHWGFNLDASLQDGPDSLSVKKHNLMIQAESVADLDPVTHLPTGKLIPVSGNPAHNHNGKLIGDHFPEKGYDDYYVFKDRPVSVLRRVQLSSLTPGFDQLKGLLTPSTITAPVVELSSKQSGLKLSFDTNQTGSMFYTNGGATPEKTALKKIYGGSGSFGDGYSPGTAAFLEFHEMLSAFSDPSRKDQDDTLLTSDELYTNYVKCEVKFLSPM